MSRGRKYNNRRRHNQRDSRGSRYSKRRKTFLGRLFEFLKEDRRYRQREKAKKEYHKRKKRRELYNDGMSMAHNPNDDTLDNFG